MIREEIIKPRCDECGCINRKKICMCQYIRCDCGAIHLKDDYNIKMVCVSCFKDFDSLNKY